MRALMLLQPQRLAKPSLTWVQHARGKGSHINMLAAATVSAKTYEICVTRFIALRKWMALPQPPTKMAAFLILLMLEIHMRPGQGLAMHALLFSPPGAVGEGTLQLGSMQIRAAKLGAPGKTGEFDSSVSRD